MALSVGSNSLDAAYLGSTAIDAIYHGSDLVWSSTPPATYPVLRSGPTNTTSSTAVSAFSLNMPAGVEVGDTLFALVASASPGPLTASAGWSAVGDFVDPDDRRLLILTKTAAGGDSLTVTPTTSARFSAKVSAFAGAVSVTASSLAVNGGTSQPNSDELTLGSSAPTRWISVVGHSGAGTAVSVGTPPSGYTYSGSIASSGTSSVHMRLHDAYRETTSNTEDPGPFSQAVTGYLAVTLAVRTS